jgi:hypothetical protein
VVQFRNFDRSLLRGRRDLNAKYAKDSLRAQRKAVGGPPDHGLLESKT